MALSAGPFYDPANPTSQPTIPGGTIVTGGNGNLTGGADPTTGHPTAPVAPTTTTTATAPTVADLYGSVGGSSLDSQAAAADAAAVAANSPDTINANLAASRSDVLNSFQDQLNAIDQAKAEAAARITSAFQPTARGRVGGATALAGATGLAGGSFGDAMVDNANTQNATDLNNQIGSSNATYDTQHQNLMQFIQTEADKEAAIRQTASTQGASAKIAEIQDRLARANISATASVTKMIQSGVDPSNPNYQSGINAIASTTGLTPDEVTALYTSTNNSLQAIAAANLKAQNEAKVAGNTTIPTGGTVIGPNGAVIASGQNPPTPVPVAGSVTYNQPGTGTGGTAPAVPSGPATSNTTAPVTLPPANAGSTAATSTPAANLNAPTQGDSHLPIAQTINGKTYDANGDPTTGPAKPGAVAPQGTPVSKGGGSGASATTQLPNGQFGTWQSLGISGSDAATLTKIGQTPSTIYSAAYSNILGGTVPGASGSAGGMGSGAALSSIKSGAISQAQQQIMAFYGITNADLPAIKSAESGLSTANATAIENKATITQYITKTSSNLKTLQSAISMYGSQASPMLNQAIQLYQGKISGDAELTAFTDALTPFLDEYAKVMNGSTGSVSGTPVSTQAQAAELLAKDMNGGQLSAGIAVMTADMAGAINAANGNIINTQNQIQNVLANFAQGKGVKVPSTPIGTASFNSVTAPDGTKISLPQSLYVGDVVALTAPNGDSQLYTIEPDQTVTPI